MAKRKAIIVTSTHENDWICEEHPELEWPHDDCPGPGMPASNRARIIVDLRKRLEAQAEAHKAEVERLKAQPIITKASHEIGCEAWLGYRCDCVYGERNELRAQLATAKLDGLRAAKDEIETLPQVAEVRAVIALLEKLIDAEAKK